MQTSQRGATSAFQGLIAPSLPGALHDPHHRQRDDGKRPGAAIEEYAYVAECSDGNWIAAMPLVSLQPNQPSILGPKNPLPNWHTQASLSSMEGSCSSFSSC